MPVSNRRHQGRVPTGQTLVPRLHAGPCQAVDVVVSKPPGNSEHGSRVNTQEVTRSAFSVDMGKSKLVPNLGTSGAYCYTEVSQFNTFFVHCIFRLSFWALKLGRLLSCSVVCELSCM